MVWLSHAEITFANGQKKSVGAFEAEDLPATGNGIIEGAGFDTFPVGVAICRYITLSLFNENEQWKSYNFLNAKIKLSLVNSDTKAKKNKGTFTVIQPEEYGDMIKLVAYDDMYKFDEEFDTSLEFPALASTIVGSIASHFGTTVKSTNFRNRLFKFNEKPKGTYRDVLGFIALITGGNARIDENGKIEIVEYKFDSTTYIDTQDFITSTIAKDNVTITGVKSTWSEGEESEDVEHIIGESNYCLNFDLSMARGQEEELLQTLSDYFVGKTFRPFEVEKENDPDIKFMDFVRLIDKSGNKYNSCVTDVNYSVLGPTVISNNAPQSLVSYNQPTSVAIVERNLKKEIKKEKSDREKALEDLSKIISDSGGLYTTVEVLEDESKIYYMHNQPTLEDSNIIWKMTAEAWGVSTDGGRTFNGGMTVDGDVIANILNANGVNADWINTGLIRSVAKDKYGNPISYFDLNSGKIYTISGEIGNWKIGDDGLFYDEENTIISVTPSGMDFLGGEGGESPFKGFRLYRNTRNGNFECAVNFMDVVNLVANYIEVKNVLVSGNITSDSGGNLNRSIRRESDSVSTDLKIYTPSLNFSNGTATYNVSNDFASIGFCIAQCTSTSTAYIITASSSSNGIITLQSRKASDGSFANTAISTKILVIGKFK